VTGSNLAAQLAVTASCDGKLRPVTGNLAASCDAFHWHHSTYFPPGVTAVLFGMPPVCRPGTDRCTPSRCGLVSPRGWLSKLMNCHLVKSGPFWLCEFLKFGIEVVLPGGGSCLGVQGLSLVMTFPEYLAQIGDFKTYPLLATAHRPLHKHDCEITAKKM
jgi:hypothetical protein